MPRLTMAIASRSSRLMAVTRNNACSTLPSTYL
jgi:hypothetical protein